MTCPLFGGVFWLVIKDLLVKGLRFQIGDGSKVSIWHDPWLPLPYSFRPFSLPMAGTEDWLVGDLIDNDSKEWIKRAFFSCAGAFF